MEKLAEEPNFKAFKLDEGEQLQLTRPIVGQVMPIECYIKPDADINNKPGLIFILVDAEGKEYVAQISQRMLQPVIDELEIMRG